MDLDQTEESEVRGLCAAAHVPPHDAVPRPRPLARVNFVLVCMLRVQVSMQVNSVNEYNSRTTRTHVLRTNNL